jgi:hypothetical protein
VKDRNKGNEMEGEVKRRAFPLPEGKKLEWQEGYDKQKLS